MVDDKELLGKAMSQISAEILTLHGKIGPFLDIIQAYLDVKEAKYAIFEPNMQYLTIKPHMERISEQY